MVSQKSSRSTKKQQNNKRPSFMSRLHHCKTNIPENERKHMEQYVREMSDKKVDNRTKKLLRKLQLLLWKHPFSDSKKQKNNTKKQTQKQEPVQRYSILSSFIIPGAATSGYHDEIEISSLTSCSDSSRSDSSRSSWADFGF